LRRRSRPDHDDRLARALATLGDAVLLTDDHTVVGWCNAAAERLFGRTGGELVGRTLRSLLTASSAEELADRLAGAGTTPFTMRAEIEQREGVTLTLASVELTVRRDRGIHDSLVTVVARPVEPATVLHEIDETLARRSLQHEVVADIGRSALLGRELGDLFDEAVRSVTDVLSVDMAVVSELTPARDELVLRAAVGFGDGFERGTIGPVGGLDAPAGITLATGTPSVFDDLLHDDRFRPPDTLVRHGVTSGAIVPLRGEDRPSGFLAVYSTTPRHFDGEDVVFLRGVANALSAAALRQRAEDRLRNRDAEARLAFDAGKMGPWTWDPATGTTTWSVELQRLAGIPEGTFGGTFRAFVERIHPDDREATMQAIAEGEARGEVVTEYRVVRPDGGVRWVESRGRPLPGPPPARWIGVTIDITDRRHAEEELRVRDTVARLALDAGGIGAWAWEPATSSIRLSEELETVFGLEPGTFPGTVDALFTLIDPEDRVAARRAIEDAARTGELLLESRMTRPDGRVVWIEARGSRIPGAPSTWVGVGIDVTDRKAADDALRRLLDAERHARAESEAASQELAETVARLDTLLQHAPIGLAFFDLDLRIVRVNESLAELLVTPAAAQLGRTLPEVAPALWPALEGPFTEVATTGHAVVGVEVAGQTAARPGIERSFLASVYPVAAPDGRLIGIGLTTAEITDRRRAERSATLIAAANELFSSSWDVDDTLQRVGEIVVPSFADSCNVYLRAARGQPRHVAVTHVDPEMRTRLLDADRRWPFDPASEGDIATALSSAPLLMEEVTGEMRERMAAGDPEHLAVIEAHGVRSAISVPLEAHGERYGVMILNYTTASGRRYEPHDVELAQELARRFAQVIETSHLRAEALRAQERLSLLAQVGELLTVELESNARLQSVARTSIPTFADSCYVFVAEPDGRVRLAALSHLDPTTRDVTDAFPEDITFPRDGEAPPAVAVRTGEPVFHPSVSPELIARIVTSERELRDARATRIRSLIAVPLPDPAGPFGALVFCYAESGRRYTDDDLPLAREIARRVAPAVENAIRFEREQQLVEVLQRSLLPEALPELPDAELAARYLPGASGVKIGGDWYDVVRVDDGRLVLAIGDVVGHGVRAAAAMGRLRNTVQFCALEGLSPSQILTRVNAYLIESESADMATLLVMSYTPETGALQLSSAGHPPPLVRDPDDTLRYLPGGRGMPLGASSAAHYGEEAVALAPGSVLVLYTDGLVERRHEPLDVGFLRLGESVARGPDDLEKLADHLLDDLLEESGPADDVAVLVMRPLAARRALQLSIPARPEQLASLRKTLRDWLTHVGASASDTYDVTLSVNEVASNAIQHAYGLGDAHFSVEGRLDDGELDLVVRDFGSWRERSGTPSKGGRGLDIVRALMDDVDIERHADGTAVRMHRRLRGAQRA
jgi:PAS domain S-box-containing protein